MRLGERIRPSPLSYARARAAMSRQPLPPGKLVDLEETEKADRYFLLHQMTHVGPIFKAVERAHLCVCIVGLERCRRFLSEHRDDVVSEIIDLRKFFPGGFLQQMEGDEHRRYRTVLVRALNSLDLADPTELEDIAAAGLAGYVRAVDENGAAPDRYRSALTDIATGMLVRLFFGASPGSGAFGTLLEMYARMGPYGLVWNPGPQQEEALGEIRDYLLARQSSREPVVPATNLIDGLAADQFQDRTVLCNLIYMMESGRYDMTGLFHWLTSYLAESPELLDALAEEVMHPAPGQRSLAEAVALETFRTDKSERLMRFTTRDIVFDGYMIPKNSKVRLCLWESHRSADVFERPFQFEPQRFIERTYSSLEFAPFGLDHHRCPFAALAVHLSVVFLRTLAQRYEIDLIKDGPPVRGAYHWEPSRSFTVSLNPREPS